MKSNPHCTIMAIVCLLFFVNVPIAQETAKKLVIIQTERQALAAKLILAREKSIEVKGEATFRLSEANSDSSLTGTFSYELSSDERQWLAHTLNKQPDELSKVLVQKDVVAQFVKDPECPTLRLQFPAMDLAYGGKILHFSRFVLELKMAVDAKVTTLTAQSILCTMARSYKTGLPPDPPIRRLNRILNGQEE